jgi:glucosamine--fructose-6-phosphate aminotransferase (isomerizing)
VCANLLARRDMCGYADGQAYVYLTELERATMPGCPAKGQSPMPDSVLQSEIAEQPATLERLLAAESAAVLKLARALKQHSYSYVLIAARGTSDNAARYAQYLFGRMLGLPVALATPSLHTQYGAAMRFDGALVIGISQSGKSPDICTVVEDARRAGAPTIAITNDPASPLAQAAADLIELHVGAERSIAATKTYTASLAALALLILSLAEDSAGLELLRAVPQAVDATLALEAPMQAIGAAISNASAMVTISRGYNYATAWEIAQKLKELTYVPTEPYSSADFQHGPIAMLSGGFPVICIAPQGAVASDLEALAPRMRERGARLVAISDVPAILDAADFPARLPASVDERFSPITAVVPGQQLSVFLARARGIDPDQPRGLRKVTETI